MALRAIDLFCGAGGSSWGAKLAGAAIVGGFDRWDLALEVFGENFPGARLYPGRLEDYDASDVAVQLGHVDLILASPECTNHSPARGRLPRCRRSKDTAFEVVRFARVLRPRWVVVENVVHMRNWSRYEELIQELGGLGYHIREQVLNAADFGVPQTRRRLFLACDLARPPAKPKGSSRSHRTAETVVNMNGGWRFSPLRTDRRAKATIERAESAMRAVGREQPFLLVYYGSDYAGWQRLNVPLRTVTTLDRFALVKPGSSGHVMRMLQPPELKAAMGFPESFSISRGTRRDCIRMVGNAVCPPVMKSVVCSLVRGTQ